MEARTREIRRQTGFPEDFLLLPLLSIKTYVQNFRRSMYYVNKVRKISRYEIKISLHKCTVTSYRCYVYSHMLDDNNERSIVTQLHDMKKMVPLDIALRW